MSSFSYKLLRRYFVFHNKLSFHISFITERCKTENSVQNFDVIKSLRLETINE